MLGTRLAVFAPLPRLGLVVVDEEHDPSYKQQDGVRYHARDVAVWRARQRGVPIVLGSATPSLEIARARAARPLPAARRCRRARSPARACRRCGSSPTRGGAMREGHRRRRCCAAIERASRAASSRWSSSTAAASRRRCCARRAAGRPAARAAARGSSCIATPASCAAITAATASALPRACPDCGNVDLLPLGHGTQRLERALAARFPTARIARIDRDSTRRDGRVRGDSRRRSTRASVDILVGTQMLAKGHDFPRLTLVGVLGADNALYSADFRATERLGALLFQVAGRAGRAAPARAR